MGFEFALAEWGVDVNHIADTWTDEQLFIYMRSLAKRKQMEAEAMSGDGKGKGKTQQVSSDELMAMANG